MDGNIKIVIGSWGSYNECNERALGSKWLDLSDYTDWEQITDELKEEGFILDGIDEELFIQDVEGLPSGCKNWDYTNPQTLFETLYESGVSDFRLSAFENRARARAGERGANAWRRMVTTWANPALGHTTLEDYANREYAELVRDYYIPRWRLFLDR